MNAPDTATPEETRTIEVAGITYPVFKPTDGQIVALMRLEHAVNRLNTTNADLLTPARQAEVKRLVYRTSTIVAGMFAEEDWWAIEDRMAAREVDWPEILDIFVAVARAWNSEDATNRAGRRAVTAKKARRA